MGLMDREYKQELDRPRPFAPPPERLGTLSKVLIFLVILLLLFLAADWKLNQQADKRSNPQPQADSNPTRPASRSTPTLQQTPVPPYPSDATGNTRAFTKCVVNGKTSYGDEACIHGAITSQVATRANHNLMEAVLPQPTPRPETTRTDESVATQISPGVNTRKTECTLIDAQIKDLDARARQPQTAATQDWLPGERKKLRDRQFRIPCQ